MNKPSLETIYEWTAKEMKTMNIDSEQLFRTYLKILGKLPVDSSSWRRWYIRLHVLEKRFSI